MRIAGRDERDVARRHRRGHRRNRGRRVETVGFQFTPYPDAVQLAILDVSNLATFGGSISRLNFRLGELYARAVLRAIRRYGPSS